MLTEKERERERRHKKREREKHKAGVGGCPEPPSEIPPMTRSYGRAMTSKVP